MRRKIKDINRPIKMSEVAMVAGVSIATVSRFLNGQLNRMSKKTADRIAKVIQETNYVSNASARQLVTKNSGIVAVVAANIDDYFSTEFFKGASSVLEQHHLNAVLFDSNSQKQREINNLKIINQQIFDGLIIQPLTSYYNSVRELISNHLETIILDRDLHTDDWLTVETNNYEIAHQASEYYLKNDFEECIIISETIRGTSTREDRFFGIRDIYQGAKLIETDNNRPFIKYNYLKMKKIYLDNLSNGKKTLFFFLKERLILNFFSLLMNDHILDNQNTAITGFSDTSVIKELFPKAKMIKQNPFLMGATAAEILSKKLEDKKISNYPNNKIIVPAEFK